MTSRRDVARYRRQQSSSARRASDFHVLRYVPGNSLVHRIWAGTKLLSFFALSIGLILWPAWKGVGIGAAVLLAAFLIARLPRGVAPRLPKWLFYIVAIGLVLSIVTGGSPYVHVAHAKVGLGGLEEFARFWAITAEILAAAALVSWTTPLADLAPALGRLTSPLRHLKVPVDEYIGAIGLAVRCLPLLLEEARILSAARRSRRMGGKRTAKSMAQEAEDIIWTALANALRRSRELAEAIEARGGVPTLAPEHHKMAWRDGVVLGIAAGALTAMALLR